MKSELVDTAEEVDEEKQLKKNQAERFRELLRDKVLC